MLQLVTSTSERSELGGGRRLNTVTWLPRSLVSNKVTRAPSPGRPGHWRDWFPGGGVEGRGLVSGGLAPGCDAFISHNHGCRTVLDTVYSLSSSSSSFSTYHF